jgi:hypothetical protein
MGWISLTEADVRTKLSGPELTALQGAALAPGQTSPLAAIVAEVAAEVRGHVAAAGRPLAAGSTIPARLQRAALALIRFELASRLPVAALMTEARTMAANDAQALLRRVADGAFEVDRPEESDPDEASRTVPDYTRALRAFGMTDQDGL